MCSLLYVIMWIILPFTVSDVSSHASFSWQEIYLHKENKQRMAESAVDGLSM